jgi:phosphate transport system substrate-binding protein
MRTRTLAIAATALAGLAVPAAASAQTLIGSGSVAAQPVLEALFKTYTQTVNHKIHFIYTADGGNAGIKDVQDGKSQFAGQARTPLPSDEGTTYIKLYLDGLCIDVNPQNKMNNISSEQLREIYLGHTTNWGAVAGSGLSTTIDPVGRDTNGGTYTFFLQAILENHAPSSVVNALTADGLVINAVKQDPSAIGYAGLAWQKKGVKPVSVNGVTCSSKYVKSFKYPLTRYIFMVLPTANPSTAVEKFTDWARTSPVAGEVINKNGGVAAFNKKAKK